MGCSNCDRPVFARGLCSLHYARKRRERPMDAPERSGELSEQLPPVRVPPALLRGVERAAKRAGTTAAEWVRAALTKAVANDG